MATPAPPPYHWSESNLIITVKVQPRASKNEWLGLHNNHFRVRVRATPSDGKANDAAMALIAETFDVPLSRVTLIRGSTSRIKQLQISLPTRLPKGIFQSTTL